MSLLVAVPCAVAAAVAYGASTAVEHSAAHEPDPDPSTAGGLIRLVRNPRWLLGMLGDTFGLVLQVVALATGPVSLVQPVLVLALPISLPIAWRLGGPRPGLTQARACLWIVLGLSLFFVLIGNPGNGDGISSRATLLTLAICVASGSAGLTLVRRRGRPVRAAIYGTVAGGWFGFVAVLMDAATTAWQRDGIDALAHPHGWVIVLSAAALGGASIALTQASFQIGALAASFPANLAADPVVAVALGAFLLHEDVPASPVHVALYVVCLAAILFGAVRLAAEPEPGPDAAATGPAETMSL